MNSKRGQRVAPRERRWIGSATEVKKLLAVRATSDTLALPMPPGVFAKIFGLPLTGKSSLTGAYGAHRVVISQIPQQGDVPLPTEKK